MRKHNEIFHAAAFSFALFHSSRCLRYSLLASISSGVAGRGFGAGAGAGGGGFGQSGAGGPYKRSFTASRRRFHSSLAPWVDARRAFSSKSVLSASRVEGKALSKVSLIHFSKAKFWRGAFPLTL